MIFSIGRGIRKIAKHTFHLSARESPRTFFNRIKHEHKNAPIKHHGRFGFGIFTVKKYRDELMAIFFMALLAAVFMTANATQRANMPIPYQGRLLDTNYVPKADETYYFRFGIYNASTGGTCLWATGGCTANAPTASVTALVSRGLFTTLLGNGGTNNPEISSSITGNFNSGSYYLEVRVCGTTDSGCETLSPRKQLAGTFYAYNSNFLDGIASTGFAQLAGQSSGQTLIGGIVANNTLTLQGNSVSTGNTATNANINFKVGDSGGTTAMTILNNGNVGIGTTAPAGLFHVSSDTAVTGLTFFTQANGSADGFDLNFRKARNTGAAPAVITTADELGVINFTGYGGAAGYITGAAIKGISSGTIGDSRVPGFLSFWTGTDAAPSVLTERMRIDSAGAVIIYSSLSAVSTITLDKYSDDNGAASYIGRKARGSSGAATATFADDYLVFLSGRGYYTTSGSGFGGNNVGGLGFQAAENFTSIAQGTYFTIGTTPTGSVTRAERMRITSAGYVGIGTTSPLAPLDIGGGDGPGATTNQIAFQWEGEGKGYRHWINTFHSNAAANNKMSFFLNTNAAAGGSSAPGTGNAEVLTLVGNGNVGIGTTSPQGALHIASNSSMNDFIINQTSATTNLIKNPSAEIAGEFAARTSATVTRDTVENYFGSTSYKVVTAGINGDGMTANVGTLTSSTDYRVSLYVKGTVPTGGVYGTLNGSNWTALISAGTYSDWTRVSATINSYTPQTVLSLGHNGTHTAGTYYVDGIQVEIGTSATPYADGSFGPGYSWSGAAHASASARSSYVSFGYNSLNFANGLGTSARGTSPALRIEQDGTGDIAQFWKTNNQYVTIKNDGSVGIGTTAPAGLVHVSSDTAAAGLSLFTQANASADGFDLNFRKARNTGAAPAVITTADELGVINFTGYGGATGYISGAAIKGISSGTIADSRVPGFLSFWTGTDAQPSVLTERMRIASGGVVNIGGTTTSTARLGELLEVHAANDYGGISLNSWNNTVAVASILDFNRSKTTSGIGNHGLVASGDRLGGISFRGSNSSAFVNAAEILGEVDGAASTGNDMPGRLVFNTTPDGSATLVERMSINSSGRVSIGKSGTSMESFLTFYPQTAGQSIFHIWNEDVSNLKFGHGALGAETADMMLYGGKLAIGTITTGNVSGGLTVSGTTRENIHLYNYNDTAVNDPNMRFRRAHGSEATPTIVAVNDNLGSIAFQGIDSTSGTYRNATYILASVDAGTPSATSMPGRLSFWTTPDASITALQRMTILAGGVVTIGGTLNASYLREGQLLQTNTSADYGGIGLNTWSATAAEGTILDFNRSKSATIGTHTTVALDDTLGRIVFRGSIGDATMGFYNFVDSAEIRASVDAEADSAMDTDDMPGRLSFWTVPNGGPILVERMRIDSAGAVKIVNLAGTGNRAVYSDGAGVLTNTSSDIRLKKNIVPLSLNIDVLAAVKYMRGIYYNWDTTVEQVKNLGNQREIGMIAQEVELVLPELVGTNANGYKSLDYPKLTAFLVEVAKAQQAILEQLANGMAVDKDYTGEPFLTVVQDGRVGIGTGAPTATLDVKEKQNADDGVGKEVFGLSSAVSSGSEPSYRVYQGKATTDQNAPLATINQFTVQPNMLYSIEAKIIQRNPVNGNGGAYTLKGVFKTDTNDLPVISQMSSTINTDFSDSASALPSFDVSENGILKITVTDDWTQTNVWTSTVFVNTLKN